MIKNDMFLKSKIVDKLESESIKYIYQNYNENIGFFYFIGETEFKSAQMFYDTIIALLGESVIRPNISFNNGSQETTKILKGDCNSITPDSKIICIDLMPISEKYVGDFISPYLNDQKYGVVVKRYGAVDKYIGKFSIKIDLISI